MMLNLHSRDSADEVSLCGLLGLRNTVQHTFASVTMRRVPAAPLAEQTVSCATSLG